MNSGEWRSLDLRDLDFGRVGEWPLAGRAALLGFALAGVLVTGYLGFVHGKIADLDAARRQETSLKAQFEQKHRLAAGLAAYQKQLGEMRGAFDAMLQKLPNRSEMDGLLRDISQTAQQDGLVQKLFQPQAARRTGFYVEQPITMEYVGSYRQIAKFVSDVSALPRIVTVRKFSLQPARKGNGAQLDFRVTAVTYRYTGGVEPDRASGKRRVGR